MVEIVSGFAGSFPALRDDDEKLSKLPRWGLGFGIQAVAVFVPCQVREDFMDHRSTWTTTVKSIALESSFLSQHRLAMTYTVT